MINEAQATWSGNGVTCNGANNKECQLTTNSTTKIEFTGTNQENLTINNGASLTVQNDNANNTDSEAMLVGSNNSAHAGSLTNNGTIQTTGSAGGNAIKIKAPIDSITNNGNISWTGNHHGISTQTYNGTQMTINSITNNASGTIGSDSGKHSAIYIGNEPASATAKSTLTTLTNSGKIFSGNETNSAGVTAGTNGTITTIDNLNTGYIQSVVVWSTGTITNLNNKGSIDKVDIRAGGNIANIKVEQGGKIGALNNANVDYTANITIDGANSSVGDIENAANAKMKGSITVQNGASLAKIGNSGTMEATITNNTSSAMSVTNNGTMSGAITSTGQTVVNNTAGTMSSAITANNGLTVSNSAGATLSGNIGATQGAIINNAGTLGGTITSNNLDITNATTGTITQNITTQVLSLKNAGNLTNTYTANEVSVSNQGTLGGAITANTQLTLANLQGGNISGAITATNGTTSIENAGAISGAVNGTNLNVNNTGQITNTLTNTSGAGVIANQAGASIKSITNTAGTLDVSNDGTINEGIKIDSGTLNLTNKGTIGKNATSNAQIELANGAKANVNEWHFDALEFKEADKDKALQVKGGVANVSLKKVYVSGAVKSGVVYDSNSFIYDVDGAKFNANASDGGKGVDVANIEHTSGLYHFSRADNQGGYTIGLDTKELSGASLGQSSIFSTRFRSISVANLLNTLEVQRFTHENNASRQNGGNFLSTQQIDENNFAYAFGYLGFESVKLPESGARMKGDTKGFLGGALRRLANERGVLGFYLGYDSTHRDAHAQRLSADEDTKFVGLSYYNEFMAKQREYYWRLGARLDFANMSATKEYGERGGSADASYKSTGYNVNAKMGMNFYDDSARWLVAPELGLNYQGQSVGAFSFDRGSLTEHYDAAQNHFVDVLAGVSAKRALSERVKLHTSLGTMLNIYDKAESKLRITHTDGSSEESPSTTISTSKWYAYAQAGLIFSLTPNVDMALHYSGIAGENSTFAHNGFVKLGVWW